MEYAFYIHDERYSVPTLVVISAMTDQTAEALAHLRLQESPRHKLVEVWREDIRVCLLSREDDLQD